MLRSAAPVVARWAMSTSVTNMAGGARLAPVVAATMQGRRLASTGVPAADHRPGAGSLIAAGIAAAGAVGLAYTDGIGPPVSTGATAASLVDTSGSGGNAQYDNLSLSVGDKGYTISWHEDDAVITRVYDDKLVLVSESKSPVPKPSSPAVSVAQPKVASTPTAAPLSNGTDVEFGLASIKGEDLFVYPDNGEQWGIRVAKGADQTPFSLGPLRSSTSAPASGSGDSVVVLSNESAALVKDINESCRNIENNLGSAAYTTSSGNNALAGFPKFDDTCKSLLKKHLSPAVFAEIRDRVTPSGFTLDNAIQSGVDNPDSGVGLYAGDEASYVVFAPLFDRVIEDYHGGFSPTDRHVSDMNPTHLHGIMDPTGAYVKSTRIRVGRNIRGLGLSPGISRAQRREVERIVTAALNKLTGDLKGRYFSLANMSEKDRQQLVDDHFLFKKGDRFLQVAGANRDWPDSRGIFHNDKKTFLVWVNEEDQMRIISMQRGGDTQAVFERLSRAIARIEQELKTAGYEFMFNDHLGYIHSCPTNCGTGMRASVHMLLPNAGKHPNFKRWCRQLRLQPRGIHGEHSESAGGVYDISNKERLGKSEVQLVQTLINGVNKLIEVEKQLAAGKSVPDRL